MFPQRYVSMMMATLAGAFLTALRANLNIAIVAMVNHTLVIDTIQGAGECSKDVAPRFENQTFAKASTGEYDWDPSIQGIILAAVSYGSVCTFIFGGILSEKFGPKKVVGMGVAATAVFSGVVPIVSELGAPYVIAARFFQGLGEGISAPGLYNLIGRWSPMKERGFATTILLVGQIFGGALSIIISGIVSESHVMGGWPAAFYIPAILTSVWLLLWCILVYNNPEEHPRISSEEKLLIKDPNYSDIYIKRRQNIPWAAMFKSVPFWALLVLRFAHVWTNSTMQTTIPLYMDSVLGLGVGKNGIINGVIHLLSFLGIFFGGITDVLRKKTNWSVTFIRKVVCFIAYTGCAACFVTMPLMGCNAVAMVALLLLAKLFIATSLAGDSVVIVDMAPRLAGTIFGTTSSIAYTSAFLSPMYTGFVTDNDISITRWSYIFYTAAVIFIVCLVFFLACGSAEVQPWAKDQEDDEKNNVTFPKNERLYGSLEESFKSSEKRGVTLKSSEKTYL